MGSGAKTALVALLVLLVVAVAKFVQEGKMANELNPITSIGQESAFGQKIQVFDVSEKDRSMSLNDLLAQAPDAKHRTAGKIIMIVFSQPNR